MASGPQEFKQSHELSRITDRQTQHQTMDFVYFDAIDGPNTSKASNSACNSASSLFHDDALLQPSPSPKSQLRTIGSTGIAPS
ncbi:hypothetical protein J1N35_007507 [Gossypium stocksii]|uniref:Uncharacterized protein n=1 Tax=Gossypium stocksii TaxID=47602 RepID=A0A9D3W677_9ROSI|nr:hypothetical protein J1N35_007507 [Gossypium stocksii]